jgi:hypothetical protein
MKKIFVLVPFLFAFFLLHAQKKFDVPTGQGILNQLPTKMNGKNFIKEKDKVRPAKGFLGTTVQRKYGDANQGVLVELINESPSLISVNNTLSNPSTLNPNKDVITNIDGFQALVQSVSREDGRIDYQVLIPIEATLLSVKGVGYTRDELIALARTIPVAAIAKKISRQ